MEINAKIAMATELLLVAVANDPKGKAGVAAKLGKGCGRSYLSRILSPNDPATLPEHIADRIISQYHVIPCCPATKREQPRAECHRLASSKAPMHNPMAMQVWKTCQTCPHKPAREGESK